MPYVYVPENVAKKKRKAIKKVVSDDSEGIKAEIRDLQKQRALIVEAARKSLKGKKGLKKFGTKLGYKSQLSQVDSAINQRQQYLANKFKIKSIQQQKEGLKARSELDELRKETIKPISEADIFGSGYY